jgi:hypothetical protein
MATASRSPGATVAGSKEVRPRTEAARTGAATHRAHAERAALAARAQRLAVLEGLETPVARAPQVGKATVAAGAETVLFPEVVKAVASVVTGVGVAATAAARHSRPAVLVSKSVASVASHAGAGRRGSGCIRS